MLTLNETKSHLRFHQDHEDTLIQAKIDAASRLVANYLNKPLDDLMVAAPAPVKAATLMLVADLYRSRQSDSGRPLSTSDTYFKLLEPYRAVPA